MAVCSNPAALTLSRLSFLVITWLPPVGLWLVVVLDARGRMWLRAASLFYFAAGAAMCVWILVDPRCITQSVCQVVIARYFHSGLFDIVYGVFYQSALVLIVFASAAGMVAASDPAARKHLAGVQMGVLGFMFPALAVRFLAPEPAGLMPSVMCHFALVFAACLVALVVRERRAEKDKPVA